jgi:hypothetical protein
MARLMARQKLLFIFLSCCICCAVLAGHLLMSKWVPSVISDLLLFVGLFAVAVAGRVSGTLASRFSYGFGRTMFSSPVRRLVGFTLRRDIQPSEVKRTPSGDKEVSYEEFSYDEVLKELETSGIIPDIVRVDLSSWQAYLKSARYEEYHPDYYKDAPRYLVHKQVQHYLSTLLTPVAGSEVWIDIASSTSPFPEIIRRLYGIRVYRQDLSYPQGVHGLRVGSDAASIPLPDGCIDRISLHCAFEHFEGSSDTGFVSEIARILKPGGVACIIPLYISNTYQILTNPRYWLNRGIPKEDGSQVRISRAYWESFGRFYDAGALKKRIINRLQMAKLNYRLIQVQLPPEIDYPPFVVLEIRKP